MGQLAAGLAHELGTPLNIIGGRAEYLLRRQRNAEELHENLYTIQSQIDRITAIVRQLLEFSRRAEPALRAVDVQWLLSNVNSLLRHKIEEKAVAVEMAASYPLPRIQADPDLLQQVFINLYLNALHAVGQGGNIKIVTSLVEDGLPAHSDAGETSWLKISFEDNGPGIRPEHIEHVFDPFFTTKDKGVGLGLFIAHNVIKAHDGYIEVESVEGKGSSFAIYLPKVRL